MKEKRRGVPLIVFGIIVIVIGIGLWVYGGIIDGNYEMHLESIFSSGHRNSTGTTLTSIGIGAIVIGAILYQKLLKLHPSLCVCLGFI